MDVEDKDKWTAYIHDRILDDPEAQWPVEAGRYRLVAARACPWAIADLDGRLPAREGDLHIDKPRTISAFSRTDLAEKLRAEGVTQVVFTGIAMGAGVEASARSAFDEGFTVTVVSDAVVDGDPERQRASLDHDIPSIGGVATIAEVVADLAKR